MVSLDGGGVDDHLQQGLVLDHGGRVVGQDAGEYGSVGIPPFLDGSADLLDTPLEPASDRICDLGTCLPDSVEDDHPDCLSGEGEAGVEVAEAARKG